MYRVARVGVDADGRAKEAQLLIKIMARRDEADGTRDKVSCTGPVMVMAHQWQQQHSDGG